MKYRQEDLVHLSQGSCSQKQVNINGLCGPSPSARATFPKPDHLTPAVAIFLTCALLGGVLPAGGAEEGAGCLQPLQSAGLR